MGGHDLLDWNGTYGGSDGCLDTNHHINKGLAECINETGISDVYEVTCESVSLADFIVISAEAMIYRLSSTYDPTRLFYFGQLGRTFRDNFRSGRITKKTCENTMPDPARGCQDVQSYLVNNVFGVCTGI